MKVYAEFFKLDEVESYRQKTLLHFGNSTELIGSAVLINPGSSSPLEENVDIEIIKKFYKENHNESLENLENWKSFSPDSTMRQLEKIFSGWYIGKEKELNGIIQLFNCFYYKSPDLGVAISKFKLDSRYNFNESHYFSKKPVYLGWGNTGKNEVLKPLALEIFEKYDIALTPIYHDFFLMNCFYHPGYINRSYKTNKITQEILNKFYNCI